VNCFFKYYNSIIFSKTEILLKIQDAIKKESTIEIELNIIDYKLRQFKKQYEGSNRTSGLVLDIYKKKVQEANVSQDIQCLLPLSQDLFSYPTPDSENSADDQNEAIKQVNESETTEKRHEKYEERKVEKSFEDIFKKKRKHTKKLKRKMKNL